MKPLLFFGSVALVGIAAMAGCAVLVGLAAQDTVTRLAPQGHFQDFDSAERASGYHILRPSMPDEWTLGGIDVSGQLTAVCFRDVDKCMDSDNRSVTYSYVLGDTATANKAPGQLVFIEMSRDEVDPFGQTREKITVRGKPAVLYRNNLSSGSSAAIEWREGELRISASIKTLPPNSTHPQPDSAITTDKLRTLLETMR